jgi:hypothetical protein
MVANALLFSLALLLAIGFYLMGELKFLVPYRTFLFHECGRALAISFGVSFLNFFAGAFVLISKFFLKDTGSKLSHSNKQSRIRHGDLPVRGRHRPSRTFQVKQQLAAASFHRRRTVSSSLPQNLYHARSNARIILRQVSQPLKSEGPDDGAAIFEVAV